MSIEVCKGLLFIGDPHVSSRRISRRKDDYLSSVLSKLETCARLCRERRLQAVITGDLFHRNDDSDLRMLNRLVAVLGLFPSRPIVVEGNHDKEQSSLGDGDALQLLALTGVVDVASTPGLFREIDVEGTRVLLHAFPHGCDIPDEVPAPSNELEQPSMSLAVTHHDLAIGSAYPGALPLKEIRGLAMVVNGHMHATKSPVQLGQTWWHNPGNIEPLSVDLRDHVPCAWEWAPSRGASSLLPHQLPHDKDVFDMTGLQVEASDADDAVQALAEKSLFAEIMQEQSGALQAERTDEAAILKEDLEFVLEASGVSAATQALLRVLAQRLASAPTGA